MDIRLQYELNDYQTYDLTKVMLAGLTRCFYNVLSGQIGYSIILGDGSSQLDALPFMEKVRVVTSSNVDLEDLRITGNVIEVTNSGSSNIEIEIGTTATSRIFYLQPNKKAEFIFNGSDWIHTEVNYITMTNADMTLADVSGPTTVIMPSSGITANRTITLPTLADNQNMEIRFENKNSTYILIVDGEGSETIDGSLTKNIGGGLKTISGQSSEWVGVNDLGKKTIIIATGAASQSIPVTTTTTVQFSTETTDEMNEYDNTTYTFTAKEDGKYRICSSVAFGSGTWTAGRYVSIAIHKNGSRVKMLDRYQAEVTNSEIVMLGGCSDILLSAGDYITIEVYQDKGTLNIYTSDENNWLNIERIR